MISKGSGVIICVLFVPVFELNYGCVVNTSHICMEKCCIEIKECNL